MKFYEIIIVSIMFIVGLSCIYLAIKLSGDKVDISNKKEKTLKEENESLQTQLDEQIFVSESSRKTNLANVELLTAKINKLEEENKKLLAELEHKDYIGQGIHNILNYNGEPQSKV